MESAGFSQKHLADQLASAAFVASDSDGGDEPDPPVPARGVGPGADLIGALSKPQAALGHAAPGGTLGLCVPERKVALAITVSKLTGPRAATKKLADLLLGEVGLGAPVGLL